MMLMKVACLSDQEETTMNQKTVARKKRKRKKIATKKLKKATLNHISPTKPTKTFFFHQIPTCGLGLGTALPTDAERGSSVPGGGLRRSKELLLSLAEVDPVGNMIPVSLGLVSDTVEKHLILTCFVYTCSNCMNDHN